MYRFHHKTAAFLSALALLGLWLCDCRTVYALPVLPEVEERAALPIETNTIEGWPEGPVVSAQSAILIDAESGVILYAKNIHEPLYPASTTKLLTCLIAVEHCSLDEVVTFSHDAIFDTPRDSSNIALDEGNELTMEQCLNAILIASANEAAFGVAEHITGTTWQDFAVLMNEKAAELGCVDSNFVNPNGLPDENHYTSAYDLAVIGRAFFANELLCRMSSSTRLDLPPTDKQPKHIIENARNQILAGRTYAYEYLVGSKTGYTMAARSALVSCAEKDGMKLIAVVLADESPNQYTDTIALFNYGFGNFERLNVSKTETRFQIDSAGFFYSSHDIFGSSKPILSLNTADCIILPKTASFADAVYTISYDTGKENTAAVITYTYHDWYIGSVSVDFAKQPDNPYAFESAPSDASKEAASNGQKVIFINIFKVLLCIVGTAGAIILIIMLRAFLKSYQFSSRDRSGRSRWLHARRKRNRYQKLRTRRLEEMEEDRELEEQRQKRKAKKARKVRKTRRAKHPNRFRDYDY
ncbi:MAG: D-alanyl-D-alanine carboxypeptidase [Lachnospiraceae bacterium]|nr:D-alanyl-D-alanine carboxypeptidase [Lachnospiraceae bacterium]